MVAGVHRLTEQPALENEQVFEQVFKEHFKSLHAYAFTILKDEAMAEEIVQNVFFKLWDKREQTMIQSSLKAYLYRSVHNESLNYLKHRQVKNIYHTYTMRQQRDQSEWSPETGIDGKELDERIRKALNELPEQCRTIFQLSRFEELKYREIAEKLELSVKTVENQMSKALQLLRLKLADFLVMLITFLLTNKLL